MKFYWNDVELTEEQYKERWAEWLEHLRLQELKEMEEEMYNMGSLPSEIFVG